MRFLFLLFLASRPGMLGGAVRGFLVAAAIMAAIVVAILICMPPPPSDGFATGNWQPPASPTAPAYAPAN